MLEIINDLIELNLSLLFSAENKQMWKDNFINKDSTKIHDHDRFSIILQEKGLIDINEENGFLCTLTEFGYNVYMNGGWLKYLKNKSESLKKINEKEYLEIELAKSNLEANKLNKKIAKQNTENEKKNRFSTWVNIIIGILNFLAILWQIVKPAT